jgi:8-oxo-dGTP pyrophosphatase MutT (NUDIX family)
MNVPQLEDRDHIIERIISRLGTQPTDFSDTMTSIRNKRKDNKAWLAAGVLLPLFYREHSGLPDGRKEEFVIPLIKRSSQVPQGGDLSCPGGILEPPRDSVFRSLIMCGIPPVLKGNARRFAKQKGHETFRNTCLFLANALRESWEEVRLNPFHIRFLGSLPTYNLSLFTKTIFPVVGLINKEPRFRLNGEVDKIVAIPLSAFFEEQNYGRYALKAPDAINRHSQTDWNFPCLIHQDRDGKEEVLWGATFNILMSFLKIVFEFCPPHSHFQRVVEHTLLPDYMTGQ